MRITSHSTYYQDLARCEPMGPAEERARALELAALRDRLETLHKTPLAEESSERRQHRAELRRIERELVDQRNAFIRANLRLVVKIAAVYSSGPLPLSDLIQEGNLGLMTAVDRFDTSHGVRFCTYASWWIRHHILRAINDLGRAVRIPSHMAQAAHKVARLERKHEAQHGRAASAEELAELAELSPRKVRRAKAVSRAVLSLDTPAAEESQPMREALTDDGTNSFEHLERAELDSALAEAFATLQPIEQEILRKRFAFDADEPLTLREIGKVHDLSRERIRQIQNRALAKMREVLEAGDATGAS
jgi:RNA polymerase primary sigma factor